VELEVIHKESRHIVIILINKFDDDKIMMTTDFFLDDERRIILDNSWVHRYVISTLDYTNIQKLTFI
jgi:hypothetical protein